MTYGERVPQKVGVSAHQRIIPDRSDRLHPFDQQGCGLGCMPKFTDKNRSQRCRLWGVGLLLQ